MRTMPKSLVSAKLKARMSMPLSASRPVMAVRVPGLAETKDFGIVRIIVDDVYKATTVLKDGGFIHQLTPVLAVLIPDEPGGLHKVLEVLREAAVNVEYMYAFLGGDDVNHAYMIFRVQDVKKAGAALAAKGVKLVNQDSISEI